jgi:hypothetical protein
MYEIIDNITGQISHYKLLCLLTSTTSSLFVWKKIMSKQAPFPVHFYFSLENCFAGKLLCYFISLQMTENPTKD